MTVYDNYKELVVDKDLVIADQAESIKTWKLLYQIARDEARALRAQLKDIEDGRGNTTQPVFSDGPTECAECCASIDEDDFYCRACGRFIDWDDAIGDEEVRR